MAEELSEEKYQQALRQKLIEEAHEVAKTDNQELTKELADLLEVMSTVTALHQSNPATVRAEQ